MSKSIYLFGIDVRLCELIDNIFGSKYQCAESSDRETNNSTTYQTKVLLTTPIFTGTYRISWYGVIDFKAGRGKFRLYNETDNITEGVELIMGASSVHERIPINGISKVEFNREIKTFSLQWAKETGDSASIQDAKIELWRVL